MAGDLAEILGNETARHFSEIHMLVQMYAVAHMSRHKLMKADIHEKLYNSMDNHLSNVEKILNKLGEK